MQRAIKRSFLLFVLPTFVAFALMFILPFLLGVGLSFTEFTTITDARFIGVKNYVAAFADADFLNALWFTTRFTIVSMVGVNLLAFCLALLLTRGLRGTNLLRTVFFMPNLIGGIVLGYVFQALLNGLLLSFGVTLITAAKYGFWGLVLLFHWQMTGYMMIIYIAGIQSIPQELINAARVDGANSLQTLRHVVLPGIMPAITICLFLTLTNSFKMFDQNLALTAGEPAKSTAMLALDIFQTFYGRVGYEGVGQAKAVVFFLLVAVIALSQLYFTRRREVDL